MNIYFYKYHGAGNDFIILDNRNGCYDSISEKQIQYLCSRRYGIGSDGLILLSAHAELDFKMDFFNPDGSGATFCGNGARCITAFAKKLEIIDKQACFEAADGLHKAVITEEKAENNYVIKLQMRDVSEPADETDHLFCHTGSPHLIVFSDNLENLAVNEKGRALSRTVRFENGETNVNFVEEKASLHIKVRTYERGVEEETHSCGTGVTASALAYSHKCGLCESPVRVSTRGGEFLVHFARKEGGFSDVWLEGPVSFVFEGDICCSLHT